MTQPPSRADDPQLQRPARWYEVVADGLVVAVPAGALLVLVLSAVDAWTL